MLAGCHRPGGAIAPQPQLMAAPSAQGAESAPAEPEPQTQPHHVAGAPNVVQAHVIQANDRFITLADVLEAAREPIRAAVDAGGSAEVVRARLQAVIRQEIRKQIDRALLLGEVGKYLSEDATKAVDEIVRKEYRMALLRAGGTRTAFERELRREGMTLAQWQRELSEGLMIQVFVRRRLGDQIHVTRAMMWDHYRAHQDEFRTVDRLQMQIIAAPFDEFMPAGGRGEQARRDAVTSARAAIDKAAAELARGVDFAKVARTHSRGPMAGKGGVWPEMDLGSFRATEVEQAAFDQSPGQVSQIIAPGGGAEGYYIVKTLVRRKGGTQTFEQVQTQIEDELRRGQYERLTEQYLSQLRAKATLVGLGPFERAAVAAAGTAAVKPG